MRRQVSWDAIALAAAAFFALVVWPTLVDLLLVPDCRTQCSKETKP